MKGCVATMFALRCLYGNIMPKNRDYNIKRIKARTVEQPFFYPLLLRPSRRRCLVALLRFYSNLIKWPAVSFSLRHSSLSTLLPPPSLLNRIHLPSPLHHRLGALLPLTMTSQREPQPPPPTRPPHPYLSPNINIPTMLFLSRLTHTPSAVDPKPVTMSVTLPLRDLIPSARQWSSTLWYAYSLMFAVVNEN